MKVKEAYQRLRRQMYNDRDILNILVSVFTYGEIIDAKIYKKKLVRAAFEMKEMEEHFERIVEYWCR